MNSVRKILLSGCVACSLFVAGVASGQEVTPDGKFRLDPVFPATPFAPFLVTEGPMAHTSFGDWAFSAVTDYSRDPFVIEAQGQTVSIVKDAAVSQLNFGFAMGFGTFLDVSVPVLLAQRGDVYDDPGHDIHVEAEGKTGVGDMRVGALFRHVLSGSWDFVFGVRGWVPTGNKDAYMSDGRIRSELLAGVTADLGPARLGCQAFAAPTSFRAYAGDRVGGNCAFDYEISSVGTYAGAEAMFSSFRYDERFSTANVARVWATLGQQLGPIDLELAGGPDIGVGPGKALFRGLLGVSFSSIGPSFLPEKKRKKILDRDFDGILDEDDACPDEAGPPSNNVTENGCPKLDMDGDGIPDDEDACPNKAGPRTSNEATTGCPDRDNDRVVDKDDACPDQPAPAYPDSDKPGCPNYVVRKGDVIVLNPPLTPDPSDQDPSIRDRELAELAFLIRADESIDVVSVEVSSHVENEEGSDAIAKAAQAAKIAEKIIDELVRHGVLRERLQPVGAMTTGQPSVRFHVAKKRKKE